MNQINNTNGANATNIKNTTQPLYEKDFEKLEMPILSQQMVLYEIIHKLIFKFPKYERYTLGEGIQETLLSSIELAIIANYTSKYDKEKILIKANAKNEILKAFIRIALNCKMIEIDKYLDVIKRLQGIGKMIQGWTKYTRSS